MGNREEMMAYILQRLDAATEAEVEEFYWFLLIQQENRQYPPIFT